MDTRKQPSRFLAMVLSLCMVFTMLPIGAILAFAADDVEVIASNTTWGTQTISKDVQIEDGVTVTVEGTITIDGDVTISGGTIARGSNSAYFNIGSGDSLTLDGVIVDGSSISSSNSMFTVNSGTLDIKSSTIQNCVKNSSRGGAINMVGGTLTIENTTIQDCSATSYGGAIYLRDGAHATIKSGTFSGNKTTLSSSSYGGGFIYNRSTLTIEGGSFLNNSSAGRGGAIYNAGTTGTAAYIRGGVFSGNTSSYSGYEGSGAVYYSAVNRAETILYISGSARFGNGTASDGTDGIYLDSDSDGDALRKMQISSALQYPINIYVACAEDRVIAQGVEGYTLTAADMTRIQFHDIGSSGTDWYAWLDSENNEVYVSETVPIYVVYDANGATGSVTDNTIYSTENNTVTVKSNDGLTYEGATFTGWNTKADGTGTTYQPGATFEITETTTLYAQWNVVEAYNVWVGGVTVTAQNASDVLGDADGDGATVSYNAETKALTLNGADITMASPVPDDVSSAAIISYENLNIVLADGSKNSITLDGSDSIMGVVALSEDGYTAKNITVSGKGSLDINLSNSSVAIGITGNDVTIDGGANVSVTADGEDNSTGIVAESSVEIVEESTVTAMASVSSEASYAMAVAIAAGTGAVTIDDSNVTASGMAGIMGMGDISITGTSTMKATGTMASMAAAGDITLADTLIAQGRADAQSGELSAVETGNVGYNTFVLSSDSSTVAKYVEIKLAHSHNICGGTDCGHDGHTAVVYTALESNISGRTLTGGNYYLTEDITNVNLSIEITGTVNLCLNGHTISGSAAYGIFRIGAGGVLNVCDCAENGEITESESHNPIFIHSGGTLNLYGGTIASRITAVVIDEDPSDTTDSTGGTVNVYGGTVSSTGNASQAIKVNAGMTDTAVNISGGEVTSLNRGISAESGEINISGGEINADSYALNIDNSAVRVYLSGSPVILGSSADIRIHTSLYLNDTVLVLHAMGDENSAYAGDRLSITSAYPGDKHYVAQGVASAEMANQLSLVGADDYYLAYDETNQTVRMYERTYTITLPSGDGYTAAAATGSTSPVKKGESYSFTVTVDSANKYYKTGNFAVKANGTTLTPDDNGVYTISDIAANQTVTVDGVALDDTAPSAEIQLGENKWNSFLNSITFGLFFKQTKTVTVTASDTGSGIAKTEYFISDTSYASTAALAEAANGNWKTYSESFSIEPNSKNIIYAKVTDNVGNVNYVSSSGIVLYTDAAQDTQSISFIKTGTTDVTANVTRNGNTIGKIYCGEDLLDPGTDYTVNGGTITFKASWLNTLAADNYTLTVHYNPLGEQYVDNSGNDAPATTTIALRVQKATGSVTNLSDLSKIYDGVAVADITFTAPSTGKKTVEYKVRDAADSTYTTEKPSAVDKYTVRVTVAADDAYTAASATANFEITYLSAPSDPFELSGTAGQNGWYTSDVTITPHEGYTVSASLNGVYSDTLTISESTQNVTIYLKNERGQITDAVSAGNIKIDKDDPTITVSGNTTKYLQSDTAKITVADSTSGVAKVEVQKDSGTFVDITDSYQNGYTATENGTYTFRVTDNAGRTASKQIIYTKIDTTTPVVSVDTGGYTDGSWTNGNVTLTVSNKAENLGVTTFAYKADDGDWQNYSGPIEIADDTDKDGVVYTFRARSASGVVSEEVSVTVKRDSVAPDGDITVKENSIKQFLNSVTFGLFFNENVDVTVTGTDGLSGVQTVQYYRSETILTPEEVQALDSWTDYSGVISETAADAEKFVYYVKVTDNAGNVTCFGSNGVTFDLTDPKISGVTDGATYYTTQIAKATDTNLQTVTVNEQPATGTITLEGNKEATYTILAADKAGNSTTVTVTMRPISVLDDSIDQLTVENVKSSDETEIEAVKSAVEAVDTTNATQAEKTALAAIIDNCDLLLSKINETAKEIASVTEAVNGYSLDSVKSADQSEIEELVDRIEALTGGDNLTQEEKANLEAVKQTANDLISKIDETTQEIASVTEAVNGYDPDSVKSADQSEIKELVERIEALIDGDHLTEEEKTNLEAVKETANDLLSKIDETTQETASVAEAVSGYDPDSVKSADQSEIKELVDRIEALINGGNLTQEEKENLEAVKQTANDLLSKIDETTQETASVAEAVNGYSLDSVKSADQSEIEALVERIDALINGGNLTQEEKENLEAVKQTANDLLSKIDETTQETANVAEAVSGYDPDSVKSADQSEIKELVERIDALIDGDNLTQEEKANLEAIKEAANDLLSKIDQTTQETASVAEAVSGYSLDSVKSADQSEIEALVERIDALINGGNLTQEEKENLEAVKETANDLLSKIDETQQASDTQAVEAVEQITDENVALTDKENLTQALEDLRTALEDYSDNYTPTQIAEIEEKINRIEGVLTVIQNVEDAAAIIEALPDPNAVQVTDKAAIQAAQNAYDRLTQHEKELLDGSLAQKLEAVQAALENAQTQTPTQSESPTQLEPQTKPETSAQGTNAGTALTPQTGVDSSLPLWIFLVVTAGAILTGTALRKTKRKSR